MRYRSTVVFWGAWTLLAGCGSGGSGDGNMGATPTPGPTSTPAPTPSPTATPTTVPNFGTVTTRIVGTPASAVSVQGAFSTVLGVAGATIADVTPLVATPNLANTKIVFASDKDDPRGELYTMNADGSRVTRLTTNTARDAAPVFSRDGTKIVFTSNRDGNNEIYIMNADGTRQTNLTSSADNDFTPSFSPDGSKIVFSSARGGQLGNIYSMNADGTGQKPLTADTTLSTAPVWSPDGTKIVYVSNNHLFVMNADGSNPKALTTSANGGSNTAPAWSPDSAKLAFTSTRGGKEAIYVMSADGSNQTKIVGSGFGEYASWWSPDGVKIAFDSLRDTNYEIYTANADGSNQTRLTNSPFRDETPAWSGFRTPRYIGVDGQFGNECAGFLLGKLGQTNASLLFFDTTTVAARADARVVASGQNTNGVSVNVTITSPTGFSNLQYFNIKEGSVTVTPTLPVGTNTVLVSLDGSTGFINKITPSIAK
jgi:Tol biopolymer transport system component